VRELRPRSPSVLVLEDLHWADEATLDVFRLLGQEIETIPGLVLATYRDDQLDRVHPLRVVLGELPRAGVRRLSFAPLSVGAVASLACRYGIDPDPSGSSRPGLEYRADVEAGVTGGSPARPAHRHMRVHSRRGARQARRLPC
jgi:hypothetical protein